MKQAKAAFPGSYARKHSLAVTFAEEFLSSAHTIANKRPQKHKLIRFKILSWRKSRNYFPINMGEQ